MNTKYNSETYQLTDADVDRLLAVDVRSEARKSVRTIDAYADGVNIGKDAAGTPVAAWLD